MKKTKKKLINIYILRLKIIAKLTQKHKITTQTFTKIFRFKTFNSNRDNAVYITKYTLKTYSENAKTLQSFHITQDIFWPKFEYQTASFPRRKVGRDVTELYNAKRPYIYIYIYIAQRSFAGRKVRRPVAQLFRVCDRYPHYGHCSQWVIDYFFN